MEDNKSRNIDNRSKKEYDDKIRANNQIFTKKKIIFCVWQTRPLPIGKNDNPAKPRVNLAEADDITMAVISQVNIVANVSDWVIDLNATMHICVNRTDLVSYIQVNEGEEFVYLGDSTTIQVLKKKRFFKLTP